MERILPDSQFLNQHFFVITSENCDNAQSRLYGYAVVDDVLYINIENFNKEIPRKAIGTYVNINATGQEITIQQDFYGLYKLYVYERDGFFAVSNSFMHLLDSISPKIPLSLNQDYAKHLLHTDLVALSFDETLINEIRLVPKDYRLIINKQKKQLTFHNCYSPIKQVPITSPEAINILDRWHQRWSSLVSSLVKNNENVRVDLSGGMDSRATFMTFISPNIDLSQVTVHSIKDTLHTHAEDYEIASEISSRLKFELNQEPVPGEATSISTDLSLSLEFLVRLGLHREASFPTRFSKKRRFFFGGSGGESLRSHWNESSSDFIKRMITRKIPFGENYASSTSRILSKTFATLNEHYGIDNTKDKYKETEELYVNTRSRNHFGSGIVKGIVLNLFELSPLLDPELLEINQITSENSDKNLLFALIYERFAPLISDIKFDSNRSISPRTLKLAKHINKTYPRATPKKSDTQLVVGRVVDNPILYHPSTTPNANPRKAFMELFESYKKNITQMFGESSYACAINYAKNVKFHPEALCMQIIAPVIAQRFIEQYRKDDLALSIIRPTPPPTLSNSSRMLINGILGVLKKCRVDIKNCGASNNDLLIRSCSHEAYTLVSPKWFSNEQGKGYCITSSSGVLNLELTCIGCGTLSIYLRGIDHRIADGKRLPLFVDYTFLELDKEVIFDNAKSAWHDTPICITRMVKDKQKMTISVKWDAHGYSQQELIKTINTLFEYPPSV